MKTLLRAIGLASLLSLLGFSILYGQDTSSNGETLRRLEILERDIISVQQQLGEVRALLRSKSSGPFEEIERFQVAIGDSAVRGSRNSKIAIIEYSDFQCPYCGRHAQTTYIGLQKHFIDTGQVLYVFRHLPIEASHPFALEAAIAAECAGQHAKFWEMHDRLFANQNALTENDLRVHAAAVGLAPQEFASCLTQEKAVGRVRRDAAQARQLGAGVTPTFFIGEILEGGILNISRKISGAQPLAAFEAALDGLGR
jgi:protein-disulfide isomerase